MMVLEEVSTSKPGVVIRTFSVVVSCIKRHAVLFYDGRIEIALHVVD